MNLHIIVSNTDLCSALPVEEQLHLQHLLGVANCQNQERDILGLACEVAGVPKQKDWPQAAVCMAPNTQAEDGGYWMLVSPVHLVLQRDYFSLYPPAMVDLTSDELNALISALDAHFMQDGIRILPSPVQRDVPTFVMRFPDSPEIETRDLVSAIGQDTRAYAPVGGGALKWHSIQNEIQMLLNTHALNQSRESAGQLPINSVWIQGGGYVDFSAIQQSITIYGGELANGLAKMSGAAYAEIPDKLSAIRGASNVWVVEASDQLPSFALLKKLLKRRLLKSVKISFPSQAGVMTFDIGQFSIWKFWRKAKSLHAALSANH